MIEDISLSKKTNAITTQGKHLFILVHGFQASSADMRIFKKYFSLYDVNASFLCSKINENNTDRDIREMGEKLADEVKIYIKHWFPKLEILSKITFISHSLGGLITRAALPLLEMYKDKMWSFISLSSPHFGYMFSKSKIVCAGLWVLKKFYGAQSLEQLSFTDKNNLNECFVYKLAMEKVSFIKYQL